MWSETMRNLMVIASCGCRKRRISLFVCFATIREDGGQALIELALIVPLFTLLLLGAAEFGTLAYQGIEVSNAARAGVAYGSQSAATAADISGMQSAAIDDGTDVAGLSAQAKQFWSCSSTPSTQNSSPPTCTGSGNHVLHYVQVATTAALSPAIHVPGLPSSYTLQGIAIMRVVQ
jgi:Flp pilus assembly protein TadG